jgi:hypothetical protein
MDDATYTYFGVDENGVIQQDGLTSGTVRQFTKSCFIKGWVTLDVMNNAGLRVAGIIETSKGWGTKNIEKRWWSDVA